MNADPHFADRFRLSLEQLKWNCPLDAIPAATTEEVEPIEGIIGQERAIKALKLGVELKSPGYNIYVCGLSGTGKATTVKSILEKMHPKAPPLKDYCYVYNFRDEDRPALLVFPQGIGAQFKNDVAEAIDLLHGKIPMLFEDENFVREKNQIVEEFNAKHAEMYKAFSEKIEKEGLVLARVQEGQSVRPDLMARIGEKAIPMRDLGSAIEEKLIEEEQAESIFKKYSHYKVELQEILRQSMQLTKVYSKRVADFESDAASNLVNMAFDELEKRYDTPAVKNYLAAMIEHIVANINNFRKEPVSSEEENAIIEIDEMVEYQVNLLLDNSRTEGCPVVIETTPTFVNLFGTIEKAYDARGMWFTDFTRIKAGSLLRADGGYLVINAFDALTEPGVWRGLQRVLLYRKLEIQGIDAYFQMSSSIIKPEPIEIDVKVIMIGNDEIYSVLDSYEHDFKKIFKIKADFDYEMDNEDEAIRQYAALIRKLCTDEGLSHFERGAIAAVVEYGARLAGGKNKLTTRFSEIADVVREANYWCQQNSNEYVTQLHVRKAIDESENRLALYEEKMQEMIQSEMMLIATSGERIGQVNGLAVYGGSRFSFGKPSRITASVGAGEAGIINIEREAKLSGRTHDKGVLILGGFLRETFAQKLPLALSASICFEQSYSGVDGDSASSTEIYALLSELARVAIRQEIAVTGSVNQKGDIQPIGGVNEKIEGFFAVCKARGLTGTQGVMIPRQNIQDLMLKDEIVEAVSEGKFHVYSISRIEEGVQILTTIPAGVKINDDDYEPDSIYGKVQARLKSFSEAKEKAKAKTSAKKKSE